MDAQNGIGIAHRPAGVDDFLAAALHFSVCALHRVEIQRLGIGARCHRRGRATTETDAHARTTDLNQQCTGQQWLLVCMRGRDIAQTTRDHDGLVVTPDDAAIRLLVSAEIAREIDPTKFIVERCAAEGAFDHDLQSRGDARRFAIPAFPRLDMPWDIQIRHRKPGEAGFRLGTNSRRALVANLATRTGRGTWPGCDCGWMVMRFDFHQNVRHIAMERELSVGPGKESLNLGTFNDRGVVRVRDNRTLRTQLVRIPDHAKERLVFAFAVDGPRSVKDLMATML